MQPILGRAFISFAIGAALLSSASARAGTYDGIVIFGDSLSDNGNLADTLTGLPLAAHGLPNPPFFHDSYTNGPVAVELLAEHFGLNANPSLFPTGFADTHNLFGPGFVPGGNYAFAGATASGAGATNLNGQVNAWSGHVGGVADPNTLYVVFIGGNDVRTDANNHTDPTTVTSLTQRGVTNELNAIKTLITDGAKNILVAGVGDVGAIPESKQRNDAAAATAASIQYNKSLTAGLAPIATLNTGVRLDFFDFFDFSHDLISTLNAEGVDTSVNDFCYNNVNNSFTGAPGFSTNAVCGPNGSNINNLAFWDNIHPTATVQAENALGLIEAVPEPASIALLASSLLGFGYFRRRQRN